MTDGCYQIGGSDSTLTSAFYLHLALRAENIADYRDRVKAKHYADIALILDGERFEMNYEEFERRIKEMSELKACPFCGDKAYLREAPDSGGKPYWEPYCGGCFCNLDGAWETQERAISAWNKRPPPEAAPLGGKKDFSQGE